MIHSVRFGNLRKILLFRQILINNLANIISEIYCEVPTKCHLLTSEFREFGYKISSKLSINMATSAEKPMVVSFQHSHFNKNVLRVKN